MSIATLRIQGVPEEVTIDDIYELCSDNAGASLTRTSSDPGEKTQTATLSFPNSESAKEFLGRRPKLKIGGKQVTVDERFLGLTVLSAGTSAVIDIIAVHGLGGHAFRTWAAQDQFMWLRDILPSQLPDARIMTYGYDSDLFNSQSVANIRDFAKRLRSSINLGRREEERGRPILFICHSLGGIVVKLAINLARAEGKENDINRVTKGIAFLATPHQGTPTADYGLIVELAAKASDMREELVKDLRSDSTRLVEIAEEFRFNHSSMEFATFYETKKTRLRRARLTILNNVVVPQSSAKLHVEHEVQIPMDRDHHTICKFDDEEDDDYKVVYHEIRRMKLAAGGKTQATELKTHFLVPYSQNPEFIGRKDVLVELGKRLSENSGGHRRIALYGLGGIGKTQIAIEYSYQLKERSSVFWVHASNYTKFEHDYRRIARVANLSGHEDMKTPILASTRDWLESPKSGDWVLILDNADDVLKFFPNEETGTVSLPRGGDISEEARMGLWKFIPQGSKGIVIITTRDFLAASRLTGKKVLQVGEMSPNDGLELLRGGNDLTTFSPEDQEALPRLVEALGNLPLAISQAVGFMYEKSQLSFQFGPLKYLNLFNETKYRNQLLRERFIDMRRDQTVPEAVLTTWNITFNQIQEQCPLAADLLKLIAFLDRQRIPEEILKSSKLADASDELKFIQALARLVGFSLLTNTHDEDRRTYEIHRLVHLATQDSLTPVDKKKWASEALELLSRLFPEDYDDSWATCKAYLPHALAVIGYTNGFDNSNKDGKLLVNVGWYMDRAGRYSDAERYLQKTLEMNKEAFGPEHLETLKILNKLALVHQDLGKYNEAEAMHRQVLVGREKALGLEHPDTLISLNNLALALWKLGKYDEAEEMNRRSLAGREKVFGTEHVETLTSLNNLGLVLQDLGKYDEAEEMHRRSLAGVEKKLGLDHPSTLANFDSLALVLRKLGKYDEAEKMHRQSLLGREKRFGLGHPSTLINFNNLALVLQRLGKYTEAEEMHRRSLAGREKVLGPKHPDTLTSASNLALVLRDQGKYKEAEVMHRRSLVGKEKIFGPEHPSTLANLNNLAVVLQHLGKYHEAEEMYRRSLIGREKVLGLKHPDTLVSLGNLAVMLREQGRYDEAEKMHWRVLAGREEVLGAEHPDTLTSLSNMALVLQGLGKYDKAEEMQRRSLVGTEKLFGREHPDTLINLSNLAAVLKSLGKYEEAEDMYRRTVAGMEIVSGPAHPDTLSSLSNLATLLRSLGKSEEVEKMYRRVVVGREKVLGPEHPSTLISISNLALALEDLGKYDEAEEMHRRSLAGREKVFGLEHPKTLTSLNNLAVVLQHSGKYEEAEGIHRQVLGKREKILGLEHPETVISIKNLAMVLRDQGKYDEAKKVLKERNQTMILEPSLSFASQSETIAESSGYSVEDTASDIADDTKKKNMNDIEEVKEVGTEENRRGKARKSFFNKLKDRANLRFRN